MSRSRKEWRCYVVVMRFNIIHAEAFQEVEAWHIRALIELGKTLDERPVDGGSIHRQKLRTERAR